MGQKQPRRISLRISERRSGRPQAPPGGVRLSRLRKGRLLPWSTRFEAMYYTPRTIAFLTELLHPPVVPDPAPIQRIHNRLFESTAPSYRSFNVTGDGAVLSNPMTQPGAVSSASFLADRFQFREELTGLTTDEFVRRAEEITAMAMAERNVQIFTAQVVTIRTLVNPKHYGDSRAFLKEGMFGFGGQLGEFGRDPQLYGMRLVFPPTKDSPNAFTVRVESFANDPRSLFLENQGSFGPIVPARGIEPLGANIRATYDFIIDRVLSFVERFDARQEA